MPTSSTYSFTIISCLSILALFSIILGPIATRLSVRAWNLNGYTGKASSALLAFDGYFTFIWAVAIIIILICLGNVSKSKAKWIVGPLSLMVQAFFLWALFLSGSAALSARHDNFNCTFSDGFYRSCNSLYNSALAFGWMSWILLTSMLIFLPYFIIAGYGDDDDSVQNRQRATQVDLERNSKIEDQGSLNQNSRSGNKAQESHPIPQPVDQNKV